MMSERRREAASEDALRRMFTEVFEAPQLDEAAISRHFHPEYVQHADGKTLDYDGFVEHVRALKAAVESTTMTIKRLVAEGDAVASFHRVSAIKRDGSRTEGKVHAYWRFRDGKIVLCDELTRMLSGSPEDRDLGSRT